jgi:hypothetical protein
MLAPSNFVSEQVDEVSKGGKLLGFALSITGPFHHDEERIVVLIEEAIPHTRPRAGDASIKLGGWGQGQESKPRIRVANALAARTGSKYSRRKAIFPPLVRRKSTYSCR